MGLADDLDEDGSRTVSLPEFTMAVQQRQRLAKAAAARGNRPGGMSGIAGADMAFELPNDQTSALAWEKITKVAQKSWAVFKNDCASLFDNLVVGAESGDIAITELGRALMSLGITLTLEQIKAFR